MDRLGAIIAERLAEWGVDELPLERMLFGSDDPDRIAAAVDAWCCTVLDATVARYVFFDASSGSVHGVVLSDGRAVVIKGHRPDVAPEYLNAIAVLQTDLADHGYPAPRPVVGPVAVGPGHLTAETMLPRDRSADAHAPAVRAVLAGGLARFVEIARPHTTRLSAQRPPMRVAVGELYPTPHSPRFDFAATAAGAEWIDELATQARDRTRGEQGTPTVVHADWRIENLCVRAGQIVAVYDWDSVGVSVEAVALATSATTFSVDWQAPPRRRFPDPSEIHGFVVDYERARGKQLGPSERDAVAAAMVTSLAYGARCEHAISRHAPPTRDSQRGLLQRIGPALLTVGLGTLDRASPNADA